MTVLHLSHLPLVLAALLLQGCANKPVEPAAQTATAAEQWHEVQLPGKKSTTYRVAQKDGRSAISARSDGSASMWRRKLSLPAERLGNTRFSWWIDEIVDGANVAVAEREDAPARVMFAFGGDLSTLPLRTRMMFDLAQALTGEAPPYATLMYVWDASAPVGSVIINPRSDRIRKIVVDSGPGQQRRWRDHQRDLVADFRLAFGENPGALLSIALMTDSDNTGTSASAWYGPVEID